MPHTKEKSQVLLAEPNGTNGRLSGVAALAALNGSRQSELELPQGIQEVLVLVSLFAAYGFFLVLGTFVHTCKLENLRDLFVLLPCWSWTNLLVLCCLASLIGEQGRRLIFGVGSGPNMKAALIRGFFILLVIMVGQILIVGTPDATAVPRHAIVAGELDLSEICLQHFFRIAAFASLLSFLVSVDPDLFRKILLHLEGKLFDLTQPTEKLNSRNDHARISPTNDAMVSRAQ